MRHAKTVTLILQYFLDELPTRFAARDWLQSCMPFTATGPGPGAGGPSESFSPGGPHSRELLTTVAPGEDKTMRHLLSSKRVAAGILGLTLALAGPVSAQATKEPAGAAPERTAETAPRREDHTDWGWLGLLGLLGLAGLLRRTDRWTGEVPRRTT